MRRARENTDTMNFFTMLSPLDVIALDGACHAERDTV
jgi:hypothetical protein